MTRNSHLIKCIYCLDSKPQTDFNREHVVPEALGKFKNNLVLHKTVCRNCNKYFGDCLEVVLNRDTAEGVYRYKFGIKPKNAPKHRRVNFHIAEGEELAGMHVRPVSESPNDISLEPVAQVGFLNRETGKYKWGTWAITKNDEAFKNKDSEVFGTPENKRGAEEEYPKEYTVHGGTTYQYDGYRDIDHTKSTGST